MLLSPRILLMNQHRLLVGVNDGQRSLVTKSPLTNLKLYNFTIKGWQACIYSINMEGK